MSGDDQDVVDAGASGFLASNQDRDRFPRSKMAEMKRFEGRLRVLEEEAEVLRGVFLEGLEGRAKLMAEIYEKLESIQHCFNLKQQQREDRCSNGDQVISPLKSVIGDVDCVQGGRAGLLHVLCQEPNPSLVNRGLKAKALQ
ncbi:hypothetical protein F511_40062 [Dorcoceras hygrometricum]|uniref:Uncharacterized protein n=1 Tax=Dorcoceras hygrometricum TaxID=472368 RepID=A0A2Z7D744_9LAMI|nr:hypothetical protein F511_40062 [Dorcoceras hygrometricum]